ncbi:MAG: TonB-dependent receptor, partial [Muribaculaceae bacterium]|nr:TonB-dependent receptor [Muribaculaceae bacterium]
ESITGQINVEFLKPQTDQSFTGNGYVDIFGKAELNAVGNVHLNNRWSTGLLLHAENGFVSHDGNSDGFIDLPRIKQFAGMNRWAYISDKYIFQAGVNFLAENRLSGQDTHHSENHLGHEPFKISIDTRRWEFFTKNAYIIDAENENNLALILSGSFHSENSKFGAKLCDIAQDNVYASLIYERNWNDGLHALSAGLSMNYDRYDIGMLLSPSMDKVPNCFIEKETTPGAYVQYTFNLNSSLILMGGFRYDHSSQYGSMFTPRVHARWNLFNGALSLYGSVGRGYRSPHVYADTRFYMASSRAHIVMDNITQEIAMNYGGGLSGMVSLFNRPLNYNAEFYYTRFNHQMLTDVDTNPHAVIIKDSENNHNFSRAFQVDVSYPIISELTFTMAYRFTDVKADYGYGLVSKPLMSKNKGLFSVSWAPMMGKWQIDATLAVNGKGRMPTPYQLEDGSMSWNTTYKTFPQLSAQITREFRNWSIYIGGENLTGYRQPTPIIDASNPWGSNFDATMVYGPVHGAMIYAGFRYNFTKY